MFQTMTDKQHLGIGVNLHYIPVHTQPHYERMGFKPDDFPQSQTYYQEAISIPMFQTMTDKQQDEVIAALRVAVQA
jgi:dTDP-4-amino-4,6-dideoxygalactose transaminase